MVNNTAARIEYNRIEVTLRDGTRVLGKDYKGEHVALTYSNLTQANKAAQKHPGAAVIQRGRSFYVRLNRGAR